VTSCVAVDLILEVLSLPAAFFRPVLEFFLTRLKQEPQLVKNLQVKELKPKDLLKKWKHLETKYKKKKTGDGEFSTHPEDNEEGAASVIVASRMRALLAKTHTVNPITNYLVGFPAPVNYPIDNVEADITDTETDCGESDGSEVSAGRNPENMSTAKGKKRAVSELEYDGCEDNSNEAFGSDNADNADNAGEGCSTKWDYRSSPGIPTESSVSATSRSFAPPEQSMLDRIRLMEPSSQKRFEGLAIDRLLEQRKGRDQRWEEGIATLGAAIQQQSKILEQQINNSRDAARQQNELLAQLAMSQNRLLDQLGR
ncbi:hypothetical protein BGZ76_007017, partial [Entomortierella beljakovae]